MILLIFSFLLHFNFGSALLIELKAHELDAEKPCPSVELMWKLNMYLEWAGLYNPYEKVYIETKHFRNMASAMVLLSISQLSKLNYVKNISTLIGKKSAEHIDGISFVVGVITVLRQYHIELIDIFIDEMAQYVVSMADYSLPYVMNA